MQRRTYTSETQKYFMHLEVSYHINLCIAEQFIWQRHKKCVLVLMHIKEGEWHPNLKSWSMRLPATGGWKLNIWGSIFPSILHWYNRPETKTNTFWLVIFMPPDFALHSVFTDLYKLTSQYLFKMKCLLLKLNQTGRREDPEHKGFLLFLMEINEIQSFIFQRRWKEALEFRL